MGLLDLIAPYKPATTGFGPNRPEQNGFTNWFNQNPYATQGLGRALASVGQGMVGHASDTAGMFSGVNDALAAQQGPLGELALQQKQYAQQQADVQQTQARQNQTVALLASKGRKDLADAVQNGLMSGADAYKALLDDSKPDYMTVPSGSTVIDKNTGKPANIPGMTGVGTLNFDDQSKLRGEVRQLPSYKNWESVEPVYKSMVDAAGRSSRASDLNLVYGLAKIMDPGSVVREGEQIMVQNTASLPDWLLGQINRLNGGAGLTPDTRTAIMTEAYSRAKAYQDSYQQDEAFYRKLAGTYNVDPLQILPEYNPVQPWQPSNNPADPLGIRNADNR